MAFFSCLGFLCHHLHLSLLQLLVWRSKTSSNFKLWINKNWNIPQLNGSQMVSWLIPNFLGSKLAPNFVPTRSKKLGLQLSSDRDLQVLQLGLFPSNHSVIIHRCEKIIRFRKIAKQLTGEVVTSTFRFSKSEALSSSRWLRKKSPDDARINQAHLFLSVLILQPLLKVLRCTPWVPLTGWKPACRSCSCSSK